MSEQQKTEKSESKKTVRCQFEGCKIKLGLVPFSCRCSKDFCIEHRGSDAHNCTFDYKAEHKKELLKTLSTPIIGTKVLMI